MFGVRELRNQVAAGAIPMRDPAGFDAATGSQPTVPPPAPAAVPVKEVPPPMESGILPGEEQVTTQDTLRALTPAEQQSLRAKYESGGHADTLTYDDWLSENFGELPPADRTAQMQASAKSTPRVNIGKDPSLPAGARSRTASGRVAAGKPLPEGRDLSHYTPDQRRTMQRNVPNPEVPMTPFGGTFTHNASGSISARAPNPVMLEQANQIAADQGEFSDSHIAMLAQAYGIDAQQYGDDLDLLRGDVMREKQRHDRFMAHHDIEDNDMGGFRYVPNAQTQADTAARNQRGFAGRIMRRYGGMLSPEDAAQIESLAGSQNGMEQLRMMNERLGRQRDMGIAAAVRDRAANFNMTRDLANPRLSPGMQLRSLIAAARAGDPLMMATLQGAYGNQQMANNAMALAGVERQAMADLEGQQMAQTGQRAPGRMADEMGQELQAALALPPGQQEQAIRLIYLKAGYPPEQVDAAVQQTMVSHYAKTDPNHPSVRPIIDAKLREGRDSFVAWATQNMGVDADQANDWYDANSETPEQAGARMGRAAAEGIGGFVSGVGGFLSGFGQGAGVPQTRPQAWGAAPPVR